MKGRTTTISEKKSAIELNEYNFLSKLFSFVFTTREIDVQCIFLPNSFFPFKNSLNEN